MKRRDLLKTSATAAVAGVRVGDEGGADTTA
jgi:hypothetical protein